MSRNNQKKSNGRKNNTSVKPKGNRKSNNFQDLSEEREYRKGYRAGKATDDTKYPIPTHSSDNDASWYVARDVMAKNVASFPFALSTGDPVPLGTKGSGNIKIGVDYQTVPGVMALTLAPFVGKCDTPNDPINVAMAALYTSMQINSSRNPQYQANDLTLFMVAMGSAYSYYMWMCRLYGTLNNYSLLNRYTPQVLIQAQGGDFQDLKSNMANFRTYINNYAYAISSFFVPSDIDYFKRQIFIYQNVYMDSDVTKGQFYLYRPAYFLKLIEGVAAGDGNVTTVVAQAVYENVDNDAEYSNETPRISGYTLDKIIALGNSIINPLRESEDVRMMSADLIKAFGASNGFMVNPIADTYSVQPVYNREVLSQFENAYIPWLPTTCRYQLAGNPTLNASNELIQVSSGTLSATTWKDFAYVTNWVDSADQTTKYDWTSNNAILPWLQKDIITNFHYVDPSPEDFIVATRFSRNPIGSISLGVTDNSSTVNTTNVLYEYGGSEVVLGGEIYTYGPSSNVLTYYIFTEELLLNQMDYTSKDVDWKGMCQYLWIRNRTHTFISAFDWYPKYHLVTSLVIPNGVAPNNVISTEQYSFDVDNWNTITQEEWDRMNFQCMLGLFECSLGDTPRLK